MKEIWTWGRNNGHFKVFVDDRGMPIIPSDHRGWRLFETHAPLGAVAVARAALWGVMALAKEKEGESGNAV